MSGTTVKAPTSTLRGLAPWLLAFAAAWILGLGADAYIDPYIYSIIIYSGINMILAVSLNLVNGFTGQFSIGHAGFMAVGGYCSAFLANLVLKPQPPAESLPSIPPALAAAAAALGVGAMIAGKTTGSGKTFRFGLGTVSTTACASLLAFVLPWLAPEGTQQRALVILSGIFLAGLVALVSGRISRQTVLSSTGGLLMAATAVLLIAIRLGAGADWSAAGPWLLTALLVVSGLLASLVGCMVGLPSLRLRGDYLAIVTLGFGEIIRVIVLNIPAIGGASGLYGIPKLTTFGWVYAWVVLTVFVVWRLVNSASGRALLSVREDEIAAESMGVNTTRAKVLAFVIGAFFAGVAGGLFAHQLMYLNPEVFNYTYSFQIITMVVLGGMGSVTGSLVAAVILTVLPEALQPLQAYTGKDYRMVIYSLLLILLMLTRPNGLFGTRELTDYLPSGLRRRLKKGHPREANA